MSKCLIILGAGATIPWGGLSGKDLTNLLHTPETLVWPPTLSDLTYRVLKRHVNFDNSLINFESVINALESIFYYYSDRTDPNQNILKSEQAFIFKLNKSVSNSISNSWPDNEQKSVNLFDEYCSYVNRIIGSIDRYANNFKNEAFDYKNNILQSLLNLLIDHYDALRVYTLNYDRHFIHCTYIDFFDGFDKPTDIPSNGIVTRDKSISVKGEIPPLFENDLYKINYDRNVNCLYNLHGSAYWKYIHHGPQSERISQYYLDQKAVSNLDQERYDINVSNPGESLLINKIITGYRKLQRFSSEPFRSIYNSFAREIYEEIDCIICIGYSFNDPHVNAIIKQSFQRHHCFFYNINYSPQFEITPTLDSVMHLIMQINSKLGINCERYALNADLSISSHDGMNYHFFSGFDFFIEKYDIYNKYF